MRTKRLGTRRVKFEALGYVLPFQKHGWTNKCKWSVIISLVIFHGKFALKILNERILWMATFIWSQGSSIEPHQCLLASNSSLIHKRLKLLKLIYGNKLVKYLHWGISKCTTFESFHTIFQRHLRSLSFSVCLRFQMANCQSDPSGRDFEGRVTLICRINI